MTADRNRLCLIFFKVSEILIDYIDENGWITEKLEELSGRFFEVLSNKKQINPALNGPGYDIFVKTVGAYLKSMAQSPTFILEQQVSYWGKTL